MERTAKGKSQRASAPLRAVIIHRDERVLSGLSKVLESCGEYRCVGCYSQARDAVEEVSRLRPHLILMEIRTFDISVAAYLAMFKGMGPPPTVVLLGEVTNEKVLSEAIAAGADSYLAKPFTAAQCLATIRFALERRTTTAQERWKNCPLLSPRENDVIRAFARGLLYKEVADQLKISYSAVHKHQHKAFLKLGVANRSEAIRKWQDTRG
jgi:DNA-binding NarL/FixJ family response regulator